MALTTLETKDAAELYKKSAERLGKAIITKLTSRGNCMLGIVGGRSMAPLLQQLAPHLRGARGRIDVFWLDERIDAAKNFTDALGPLQAIRSSLVEIYWHPIKSTRTEDALMEANGTLKHMEKARGTREFDIVVLSAGEDGHIASLFPGNKALNATGRSYVLVEGCPKPPADRVSVTPELLLSAKEGFLFFVGEKQKPYIKFLDPNVKVRECPAKLLNKLPQLTLCLAL